MSAAPDQSVWVDTSTIISSYIVVPHTLKNITALGRQLPVVSVHRGAITAKPQSAPDKRVRLVGTTSMTATATFESSIPSTSRAASERLYRPYPTMCITATAHNTVAATPTTDCAIARPFSRRRKGRCRSQIAAVRAYTSSSSGGAVAMPAVGCWAAAMTVMLTMTTRAR